MPHREDYRLRPMEEADLEPVLVWRNAPRIRAAMFTDHVIALDEHRAWFERARHQATARHCIFEGHGQALGVVNVTGIDRRHNRADWGFYLGVEDAPRGTGTILGLVALEFIFETLRLRKLCGQALASNAASVRLHQRLGFAQEGRLVRHVLKSQTYEDVLEFALFDDDWARLKPQLAQLCFGDQP